MIGILLLVPLRFLLTLQCQHPIPDCDLNILFAHSRQFGLEDKLVLILANVDGRSADPAWFGSAHARPRAKKVRAEKVVKYTIHLRPHLGERISIARCDTPDCLLLLDVLCHGKLLSCRVAEVWT